MPNMDPAMGGHFICLGLEIEGAANHFDCHFFNQLGLQSRLVDFFYRFYYLLQHITGLAPDEGVTHFVAGRL